ncbi:MAG: M23 family metallopeptidase [Eubacteriales bacterium]|nr:M23 family metallopeptidase [Eubacteriales bacterium]
MRKIMIFIAALFLIILITIATANNVNNEISLNPNYFFKSPYEERLDLTIETEGEIVVLSPSGDFYYKNPLGLYSVLSKSDTTIKSLKIDETANTLLKSDIEPNHMTIRLKDNDAVVYESISDLLASIDKNGAYPVVIDVTWEKLDGKDYYGSLQYRVDLDVTLHPELQIKTVDNFPGNILVLTVSNIKDGYRTELTTDLSHGSISSAPMGDSLVYFIPVDIWAKAGDYVVNIEIKNDVEQIIANLSHTVNINDKNFVTQYLYISEEVYETTNSDAAYKEFRERAQAARTVSTMKKLWDGEFILPVKDDHVLTTDYGEIRYVNDRITSSRHSGLDLAAPTGTEIFACNSGNVVLSEYLILTGNTIIIDHGLGVFTSYYHLDTLSSQEGDFVSKGDFVGTMGSTGFSTGPHLHWSISIYNTYVNTWQVLEYDLLP